MLDNLHHGDNLNGLRRHVKDDAFVVRALAPDVRANGLKPALRALPDIWRGDRAAAEAVHAVVEAGSRVAQAMIAFRTFLGENDLLACLANMTPRLIELRTVLKPTGSLYRHCAPPPY